ncbi:unnamed protein product [Durusdinium trenchii]
MQWKFQPKELLDTACAVAREGHLVIAVNAASAYHAGGGFTTGGRHALEESICMRSTLFASLQKAETLAQDAKVAASTHCRPETSKQNKPWACHIPEVGCIVSPNVEVFRGGTGEGYPFYSPDEVSKITIVSVAMPNCNEKVTDAPVDCPTDEAVYEKLIRDKFRAVLSAAQEEIASQSLQPAALVIPDVGCGTYGNDRKVVGRLLGQALRDFGPIFSEVHVVGSQAEDLFNEAKQQFAEA